MAITLVGATDNSYGSADPAIQTTPIDVQAGDVVLAFITVTYLGGPGGTLFGAGGWTLHADATCTLGTGESFGGDAAPGANQVQHEVRVWPVSSGGSLKLQRDMSSTRNGRLAVAVFRGVDTDDPVVANSIVARGNSTSPTAATVAASAAGDWHIGALGVYPLALTVTETSSWTSISKYSSTGVGQSNSTLLLDRFQATDTTARTSAPSLSIAGEWVLANFVLRAAPEVVPGTVISRGIFL